MRRNTATACTLPRVDILRDVAAEGNSFAEQVEALKQTNNDISEWVDALLATAEDGVLLFSQSWELLHVNPAATASTGFDYNTLCGASAAPLFGSEERFADFRRQMEKVLAMEGSVSFGFHLQRADGELFPAECRAAQVCRGTVGAEGEEAPRELGVICIFNDMSERLRNDRAIRESEARFRSIFNSVYDAVFLHELDGAIIDVNDSMLHMYGVTRDQAPLLSISEDYSSRDNPLEDLPLYWREAVNGNPQLFEWTARRPGDGVEFPVEVYLSRIILGNRDAVLANVRDISERKQFEERLRHLADTDHLTSVSNRRRFLEQAGREFARAKRYGSPFTVLMIDIDHFKQVNDTFGHHAGDAVLKALAAVCGRELRETDLFGRLGGEEFAAVLPESSADFNPRPAREVAERLREALAEAEVQCDGAAIRTTVSIGIASYHVEDENFDDVLRRADEAMYKAKQAGRNRVVMG